MATALATPNNQDTVMAFGAIRQLKRSNWDFTTVEVPPRAAVWTVAIVAAVCTLLALASLVIWVRVNPARDLVAEVPGMDGYDPATAAVRARVDLTGVFERFDGQPSTLTASWTRFRGADSSNVVLDAPKLLDAWGPEGPEKVWAVPVGDGYASPVVFGGCVYLMDYDVENRSDALRCLSLDDGREIWRHSYGNNMKRNHGMSRTIPAVTPEYLLVMGPRCHVLCLDTATGAFRWGIDLQLDYGTVEPLWYTGQCPIIDNGQAIVAPCGTDVLMMGVDCVTGEVLWKTPNPNAWNMSHSSIIPMTLLGKPMYVYGALGGMTAVSAAPEDAGTPLWDIPWDAKVLAPSPVQVGDDLIFVTAGYGRGSRLLRVHPEGSGYRIEVVYDRPPGEILSCEQQTPIFHEGLLYGILPKDAGALKGQFACYRPEGELVWSSGSDKRFGLGPFLLADNKFILLDDEGVLTLADATTGSFAPLASADMLEGHDAWGPLALAGSRLLLRDMNTLACIELGAAS
jgi:outer membrane protein assembly factor BamB